MYLIAYDISDDKIRNKIAKYLEKKGLRIQKSLFALEVNKNKIKHILRDLEILRKDENKIKHILRDLEILRKDDGIIHSFSVCKICAKKSKVIGKKIPDPFFFFD